jgi:hypothetical protein
VHGQILDLVVGNLEAGNPSLVRLVCQSFLVKVDVRLGAGLRLDGDLADVFGDLCLVKFLALNLAGLELRLDDDALVLGVALGRH